MVVGGGGRGVVVVVAVVLVCWMSKTVQVEVERGGRGRNPVGWRQAINLSPRNLDSFIDF